MTLINEQNLSLVSPRTGLLCRNRMLPLGGLMPLRICGAHVFTNLLKTALRPPNLRRSAQEPWLEPSSDVDPPPQLRLG